MCPWIACERTAPGALTSFAAPVVRRQSLLARPLLAALVSVLLLFPALASAQGSWEPLTRKLADDGFDPVRLNALFSRAEVRFDPQVMARKMNALLEVKLSVGKPKPEVPELYESYLNPFLLLQARGFLASQRPVLSAVKARYGVPEEILTALLLVETKLGRNIGSKSALSTLASMALAGDFSLIASHFDHREVPPELALWLRLRTAQKGAWAYKELKALLTYANKAGVDPAGIPGSVYGAIGICQFMPTNAVRYGADFDGDGRVDLFETGDALMSAGRFLAEHGWRPNLTREKQMAVLYRYNHSHPYTRTIMAVADRLRD